MNAQGPRLLAAAAGDSLGVSVSGAESAMPWFALPPSTGRSAPSLSASATLPCMSQELALQVYQQRSAMQASSLGSYSATTLIRAQLPDTAQSAELEAQRHYTTPRSLQFKAVHFSGDGFVKSNVIARMLQSEVDHVRKDDPALTALDSSNYKFSYKGVSQLDGRPVHIYQVKPQQKRVGLFKGRMYLDAHSGSLARVEGSIVKSPSFFVKKIDFTQDYADFSGFTFPVRMHSDARARIIGRTVVDIDYRDYQPMPAAHQPSPTTPAMSRSFNRQAAIEN